MLVHWKFEFTSPQPIQCWPARRGSGVSRFLPQIPAHQKSRNCPIDLKKSSFGVAPILPFLIPGNMIFQLLICNSPEACRRKWRTVSTLASGSSSTSQQLPQSTNTSHKSSFSPCSELTTEKRQLFSSPKILLDFYKRMFFTILCWTKSFHPISTLVCGCSMARYNATKHFWFVSPLQPVSCVAIAAASWRRLLWSRCLLLMNWMFPWKHLLTPLAADWQVPTVVFLRTNARNQLYYQLPSRAQCVCKARKKSRHQRLACDA